MLASFVLLVAGVSFAQEEAETKMWVGGSFSVNNTSVTTDIAFNPEFGIFLNDSWAVGGKLNVGHDTNSGTTSSALVPYARYSILKLGKVTLFGQGELYIGLSNNNITELRVLPVLTYPVYKNFGLTATLPSVLRVGDGYFGFDVNSNLDPGRIGLTYKF